MKKIYIFGHRKPDTDAVCSAISLAYLKNKQGLCAEAKVLSAINKETKYVLDYFNYKEPAYLNDVKIKLKDINYNKNIYLNENLSLKEAYDYIIKKEISCIPIVNDDKKLIGLLTVKDIMQYLLNDIYILDTSYTNILKVVVGNQLLKFDEDIKGKYSLINDNLNNEISIINKNCLINKEMLKTHIKLLILEDNYQLSKDILNLCKDNKINVITSKYKLNQIIFNLKMTTLIKNINFNKQPVTFNKNEYRSEILDKLTKFTYTAYPVVDNHLRCLGLFNITDVNSYQKQKVILVDHNQKIQSVEGLDEAEIVEIIDHHNIQMLGTLMPISFRSMPVGSTCSIIYQLFEEATIKIPKKIAGLMLAAILSDTMILKSPTTTQLDIDIAEKLANKNHIDIQKFGAQIFKAGTTIKGMSISQVINQDLKTYKVGDEKIAISQLFTMDYDDIQNNISCYIEILDQMVETGFKIAIVFVSDVIKNGSYVIYSSNAQNIISDSFNLKEVTQGIYLPGIVSRKTQMVPNIIENVEHIL